MSGTAPQDWYPQEAHYAPGWQAPVPAAPPPRRHVRRRTIVLGVVGLVVLLAVAAGAVLLLRSAGLRTLGEVTSPRTANAQQLAVGHCVASLADDGAVGQVRVVPCDDPHEAEVVGVHTFDDGPWPGATAVQREASAACEMDSAQTEAGFRPVVWTPSERSWGEGDREGLCLAVAPDGPVTGSWRTGDVAPG